MPIPLVYVELCVHHHGCGSKIWVVLPSATQSSVFLPLFTHYCKYIHFPRLENTITKHHLLSKPQCSWTLLIFTFYLPFSNYYCQTSCKNILHFSFLFLLCALLYPTVPFLPLLSLTIFSSKITYDIELYYHLSSLSAFWFVKFNLLYSPNICINILIH